jgi:hypothetical protein
MNGGKHYQEGATSTSSLWCLPLRNMAFIEPCLLKYARSKEKGFQRTSFTAIKESSLVCLKTRGVSTSAVCSEYPWRSVKGLRMTL